MKGFQGRPSLQSTTASRGSPKQGPRSSPPPTMSSSPRSAHPTPSSLNSPFLQGPSFNDSSLNSPFLQGPSLNEIENCLTGLSAEEMEQVGDHHFGHKPNKVSDNSVEKKTISHWFLHKSNTNCHPNNLLSRCSGLCKETCRREHISRLYQNYDNPKSKLW